MKSISLGAICLMAVFSGCAQTNHEPIVLDDYSRLEEYVGEAVTLRGIVPNTKTLCINGVMIEGDDIRGEHAEATGILKTYEITSIYDELGMEIQTLPPGRYYRLIDPETGMLAEARVIE